MKTEFIPYEQALELKELGFDIPSVSGYSYPDSDNLLTEAILYQQAFRWFREKYNIHIRIGKYDETKWWANWGSWTSEVYEIYEEAELDCLKKLIEIAKNGK